MKTSIRYAKENDREKWERGRRRDINREGEIRERQRFKGYREWKGEA